MVSAIGAIFNLAAYLVLCYSGISPLKMPNALAVNLFFILISLIPLWFMAFLSGMAGVDRGYRLQKRAARSISGLSTFGGSVFLVYLWLFVISGLFSDAVRKPFFKIAFVHIIFGVLFASITRFLLRFIGPPEKTWEDSGGYGDRHGTDWEDSEFDETDERPSAKALRYDLERVEVNTRAFFEDLDAEEAMAEPDDDLEDEDVEDEEGDEEDFDYDFGDGTFNSGPSLTEDYFHLTGAEFYRYCETLDVRPGTSEAALKSAYRRRIRVYHPDKYLHRGEDILKIAEAKAREINIAYRELKLICDMNDGHI